MIACSRPWDSKAQCWDGGELVKLYAEEKRGMSLTLFFLVKFSTTLYYLNAWNRLSLRQKGFCCVYFLIHVQTYIWSKCGETDLKYIERLWKKLFSDIMHTSSLMLIVLIIWCKNCLVSSRNCRTWRLLSSWWNSWTLKKQNQKLIFMMFSKLYSGIQWRVLVCYLYHYSIT